MVQKKPNFVSFLEDEFSRMTDVEALRFFGGWQFRSSGKQFAVLIREVLYFSVDAKMRTALEAAGGKPFWYDKGGKIITVGRYVSAPDGIMDDTDALVYWTRLALAVQ